MTFTSNIFILPLLGKNTRLKNYKPLVSWSVICKDKKHGGLGPRHLEVFNQALLGKWLWRFPLERGSFWRKVIVGKFGEEEEGWTTREVRNSYGMGLWKDIRLGGFPS